MEHTYMYPLCTEAYIGPKNNLYSVYTTSTIDPVGLQTSSSIDCLLLSNAIKKEDRDQEYLEKIARKRQKIESNGNRQTLGPSDPLAHNILDAILNDN